MPSEVEKQPAHVWSDVVQPGESAEVSLAVSESYSGLTLPSIAPGDPICHLGILDSDAPTPRRIERTRDRLPDDHLHERITGDLATNVMVTEERPAEDEPA